MDKVLVTGGAGYIGSFVVQLLLDKGYAVRVLDDFEYGKKGMDGWANHPSVEVFEGDICNIKDLVKAMKGVKSVIALAAIVGDPACELDPDETESSNYEATKILVEIAKKSKVQRIVFASSCSVYGASKEGLLNEGSLLNPVSLYAKTRVLSERVLMAHTDEIEVVVLRLATVFGISKRKRFDLVVNILSAKAACHGEIDIYGKDQQRPIVHVQDAARAFVMASEADTAQVNGQVFNVGSNDMNFTVGQLGETIAAEFEDCSIVYHDVEDLRDYRCDFAKIRTVLGYSTESNLSHGIQEFKQLFTDHPEFDFEKDDFYNVRYLYKYRDSIGNVKTNRS